MDDLRKDNFSWISQEINIWDEAAWFQAVYITGTNRSVSIPAVTLELYPADPDYWRF